MARDAASPRKESLSADFLAFAEVVGEFIQHWGFRPIQGRLWAVLYLGNKPRSAAELASLLKVSKALVSQAFPELLAYRVVRETGKGKGRTVFYEATSDVTIAISTVLREREQKIIARSAHALDRVRAKKAPEVDAKRAADLAQFIAGTQTMLEGLLALYQKRG